MAHASVARQLVLAATIFVAIALELAVAVVIILYRSRQAKTRGNWVTPVIKRAQLLEEARAAPTPARLEEIRVLSSEIRTALVGPWPAGIREEILAKVQLSEARKAALALMKGDTAKASHHLRVLARIDAPLLRAAFSYVGQDRT